MYIYLIVNSETGKYYVGQHKGTNLKKYLQMKLSQSDYELKRKGHGSGSHLFASMRKYPKDVWSIHPLMSTLTTKADLDHWETFLIASMKSRDPNIGYNICRGGEGFTGTHSQAARDKVSEATRLRFQDRAYRDRNKQHLQKVSSQGGWPTWTPEQQKARSDKQHITPKLHQQNTKDKIAARLMGNTNGKGHNKGALIASHNRWHVGRGIVNASCSLCVCIS